jgi:hypothetical protein
VCHDAVEPDTGEGQRQDAKESGDLRQHPLRPNGIVDLGGERPHVEKQVRIDPGDLWSAKTIPLLKSAQYGQ